MPTVFLDRQTTTDPVDQRDRRVHRRLTPAAAGSSILHDTPRRVSPWGCLLIHTARRPA